MGKSKEVWFLNRGLVILRPREPFIKWVQEVDPNDEPLGDAAIASYSAAYLIPDCESEEESWEWVRSNFRFLFEFALNEWYTDEELWPKRRLWKTFQQWFDLEFIEMVWDLVDQPLTSNPDDPEHQLN